MYESEEEEEQEKSEDYCKGGYHLVRIGDTFCQNRYRAIRKLGWGAFSTVWLCEDIKSNGYVAIKILKSKKSYGQTAAEEIQMLLDVKKADPSHPFSDKVVILLDSFILKGDNGKHKCLVFEVLGESLLELIQRSFRNGIPIEPLKPIIRQILEALLYLHTKCHLIHTDIKPENILLTTNQTKIKEMHSEVNRLVNICGKRQLPISFVSTAHLSEDNYLTNEDKSIENICLNPNSEYKTFGKQSDIFDEDLSEITIKIADLGNACLVKGNHCSTIQTRPYRSPEVILGFGFSTSADIWSTACTAFELATGHLLFNPKQSNQCSRNDSHLAKMLQILGRPPTVFRRAKDYYKYFDKRDRLLNFKVNQKYSLERLLVTKNGWAPTVAQSFSEFLLPMLQMDPRKRASAQECLSHEWLNT